MEAHSYNQSTNHRLLEDITSFPSFLFQVLELLSYKYNLEKFPLKFQVTLFFVFCKIEILLFPMHDDQSLILLQLTNDHGMLRHTSSYSSQCQFTKDFLFQLLSLVKVYGLETYLGQ